MESVTNVYDILWVFRSAPWLRGEIVMGGYNSQPVVTLDDG